MGVSVGCVGKNMSQWEFPKIPFLVLVSSSYLIYYWLINELHFLFPSPTRTVCVGIGQYSFLRRKFRQNTEKRDAQARVCCGVQSIGMRACVVSPVFMPLCCVRASCAPWSLSRAQCLCVCVWCAARGAVCCSVRAHHAGVEATY